jgi:hypothetical protein
MRPAKPGFLRNRLLLRIGRPPDRNLLSNPFKVSSPFQCPNLRQQHLRGRLAAWSTEPSSQEIRRFLG